jgi:hypothetical protein
MVRIERSGFTVFPVVDIEGGEKIGIRFSDEVKGLFRGSLAEQLDAANREASALVGEQQEENLPKPDPELPES